VQLESPPGAPQQIIKLRPERLRAYGIQPVAVLDAIQTAYQGTVVGQTYEGNRSFDITVQLVQRLRQQPEKVGRLLVRNPDGALLPVSALADIYFDTGRYLIAHEGARRRQAVTCNVSGRDVDSFVAEAKGQLASVLPKGVYAVFTGVAEAKAAAQRDILVYSLLAGAGVALLLAIALRNGRNLLLLAANLPFALVGGVVAIFCTGGWLTVGSLVGLVTLFGISTRNSIMLVSHFEHLVVEEACEWNLDTALRGAAERFIPIAMTALVTALGLLPIAASYGQPGQEIEAPMAMVILAGLVTSTLLNLFVMPTFALRFGRFEKPADETP
jgi:Cu/Ag efflux pump CusA